MAETHSDKDIEISEWDRTMARLATKAAAMAEGGENLITGGRPGEPVVWERQVGRLFVRQLPDDPDALRISIGEANNAPADVDTGYVVFRGDPRDVEELLQRALAAIQAAF